MKLKNFIKTPKKEEIKNKKSFHLIKKSSKQSRAAEKEKTKKNKRAYKITYIAGLLFIIAGLIFSSVFFYFNYVMPKINTSDILVPGDINIIEISEARQILSENDIEIQKLEYSSSSAGLILNTKEGTEIFFSDTVKFDEQVILLKKILTSLKNQDKNARVVDLRYNRPIVKF